MIYIEWNVDQFNFLQVLFLLYGVEKDFRLSRANWLNAGPDQHRVIGIAEVQWAFDAYLTYILV